MATTSKNIKFIDVNLFSGSQDHLRTELGFYYHVVQPTDPDITGDVIEYHDMSEQQLEALTHEQKELNGVVFSDTPRSDSLLYEQINLYLSTTSSANLFFKNKRIPVRIVGDQSTILADEHWKIKLLGGTYATSSYRPIYTRATFNDFSYDYDIPYSMVEAKKLAAHSTNVSSFENYDYYEIGYRYEMFLKQYEQRISNEQVKLIPNAYMLKAVDNSGDPASEYPEFIRNFVSVEGKDPQIINGDLANSIFEHSDLQYPPPYTTTLMYTDPGGEILYRDHSAKMRSYLTGTYASTAYSSETTQLINRSAPVLYFNGEFMDRWFSGFTETDPDSAISKMPFYTVIEFPTVPESKSKTTEGTMPTEIKTLTSIIKDNKLENEFLMSLENEFTPFKTKNVNYVQETTLHTGSTGGEIATLTTAKNKTFASRDYLEILKGIYDNSQKPGSFRGLIMGRQTLAGSTANNYNSKYRYNKTIKAFKALQETKELVDNQNILSEFSEDTKSLQALLNYLKNNKEPIETIAYKIRKVSGNFLGNQRTVEDSQDIYFINDESISYAPGAKMSYYDTQVKYGQDYQYRVYAYVLVPGYEYKYSDLRISRQIGKVATMDETGFPAITSDPEKYCLEFFDPNTGLASPQLLNEDTNLQGTDYVPLETTENLIVFERLIDNESLKMSDVDPDKYGSYAAYATISSTMLTSEVPSEVAIVLGSPNPDMLVKDYIQTFVDAFIITDPEVLAAQRAMMVSELYKTWSVATVQAYDEDTGKLHTLVEPSTNRFATNAQIKSENPYLADFYFHWMPTVKVVEVPIAFNTVRIMDNPPVAADITPYQRKDDSQVIGFYINVESFRFSPNPTDTTTQSKIGTYPTPMSDEEQLKKQIFLQSNNMLPDEVIKNNSVSKITSLEVYRIDKKPTSIRDFNDNLVFSKDLSMKNNRDYKYTNCFYEEMVQTNKKYYYLFRFLNEHGDGGYIAPIQVAELIDDGGYKYSTFDVIFESEFEKQEAKQDSRDFKKLLEISPSLRHLTINDSDINYNQTAAEQLPSLVNKIGDAGDRIWGKTFKFRLTSKKTGRKIDFNIKYNLRGS